MRACRFFAGVVGVLNKFQDDPGSSPGQAGVVLSAYRFVIFWAETVG